MIITRTPFRVSFAGGGSDLREYYMHNGYGAVVSSAIRRYMYIVIHPYFHDKIRIKYSKTEDVSQIDEISHPIVRECLRKVNIDTGIEIASFADIPAGTGLGSSSAFTVGLLNALYAYQGKRVSKDRLAAEACEVEIDILGEPIGKQDQYAAAFGNLNFIQFNDDESVNVAPLVLGKSFCDALERKLRLFYIRGKRSSGDILHEQKQNLKISKAIHHIKSMVMLAEELRRKLENRQIDQLGQILHSGWIHKRNLASGISNEHIDKTYSELRRKGVQGGKLLGAGGGGFLLLFARDFQPIEQDMKRLALPFKIDREGTKVIFYE